MHFGGIRLGTEAGDLHRGWVWDGERGHLGGRMAGRAPSWPTTGVTHRVVHLDVVDKAGAPTTCAATCCGWPTSAGPAAPWSTRAWPAGPTTTPPGATRTGYGICEYLHQLDDGGRPVVPVE